mmetsp:Transcript_101512/g.286319  ORF Transcript_101512/g.286319 Transcript_101512/m.286319 type:complete len:178 (+) Transcript_101512:117-650(+)|eukprot:CAMPEP_0117527378 /NCGR_PEP_ID=MMETSP0784-20121206/36766_1 /TAXON_ID=39447 /ORGANISM="" /LENGTH=177 /DNA_ID=CAMNT_0005323627 /DNA_START=118 /DNA_END=651 /DNA_ORIENTATION=+
MASAGGVHTQALANVTDVAVSSSSATPPVVLPSAATASVAAASSEVGLSTAASASGSFSLVPLMAMLLVALVLVGMLYYSKKGSSSVRQTRKGGYHALDASRMGVDSMEEEGGHSDDEGLLQARSQGRAVELQRHGAEEGGASSSSARGGGRGTRLNGTQQVGVTVEGIEGIDFDML